jgi:hypothetical protein
MLALSVGKPNEVCEARGGQQGVFDALFIADETDKEEGLQRKIKRGRLVVVVSTLLWR